MFFSIWMLQDGTASFLYKKRGWKTKKEHWKIFADTFKETNKEEIMEVMLHDPTRRMFQETHVFWYFSYFSPSLAYIAS